MNIFSESELERFPPLMDIPTTAQFLNSTRQHIYNQIQKGAIQIIKVGKKILIPRDLLVKNLLENTLKEVK